MKTAQASVPLKKVNTRFTGFMESVVPSQISTNAKYFLAGSFINGFSNGILNAVMVLYLTTFGFNGQNLGSIFMMNALSATILTVPVGILADRYGKKKVIIAGLVAVTVAMTMFFMSNSMTTFAISFLFIGVANSTGTVIAPLYSSFYEKEDMDPAFGLWQVIMISAMSLGSLGGYAPQIMMSAYGIDLATAYRYVMIFAGSLFILPSFLYLKSCTGMEETLVKEFAFRLKSKSFIIKICALNLFSSIAGGIMFSLFPFYVNQKYGIQSDGLGTLFFVSNLAMAFTKGIAAGIAKSLGRMRSITLGIGASAIFLMLMPLSPSFGILAIFYVIRQGTRFMSDPLLSSLFMRTISEDEKSTANSIRLISMNGGNIVSPWLGGTLMEKVGLDSPAYIGASLTLIAAALYPILLKKEINEVDARERIASHAVER